MSTDEFIATARQRITEYVNKGSKEPLRSEVFNVWHSYVLGNHKGIFGIAGDDNRLFEVTWWSDKKELYLDVYTQEDHVEIPRYI